MVIWTQMSAFAALKALTMSLRASESGGVWLVQNFTTVAFAAHVAPVIADGSALAPAACEAEALGASLVAADGAAALAAADALGLELVELQADTTRTIDVKATNHCTRPSGRMAPPTLGPKAARPSRLEDRGGARLAAQQGARRGAGFRGARSSIDAQRFLRRRDRVRLDVEPRLRV
jgi:hypothetical protein